MQTAQRFTPAVPQLIDPHPADFWQDAGHDYAIPGVAPKDQPAWRILEWEEEGRICANLQISQFDGPLFFAAELDSLQHPETVIYQDRPDGPQYSWTIPADLRKTGRKARSSWAILDACFQAVMQAQIWEARGYRIVGNYAIDDYGREIARIA